MHGTVANVNGFQGVQAAAITPRGKHGEVDFGAAFELVDHLCKGGVQGILLFGPPGEYPAFAADERARLVYLAVKRSRVPVLAGVGAATLDTSLELAREARDAGAGALVLPPAVRPLMTFAMASLADTGVGGKRTPTPLA